MRDRSISDNEIALIKAMLNRGMKNKDIQFLFNRPDRAVNSGRITGIRKGKYGDSGKINPAQDAELDTFLATKKIGASPTGTTSVADVGRGVSPPAIADLFAQDGDGIWRLKYRETDQHECKLSFGFRYAAVWLRAIAALANNRGGYVLLGVHDKDSPKPGEEDKSYKVIGLASDEFSKADPHEFSMRIKATFDPTPRVEIATHTVAGKQVGVIYVERHESGPIIATRPDGDQLKEGDIFYRYPGQSTRIKYSDLRAMLDYRDLQSRKSVLPLVERLLALGPKRAMIADLQSGELSDGKSVIQIDENLLDKINFIREGQFDLKEGLPTLRLIGEVKMVGDHGGSVQKGFVTKADLIRDFLAQKTPYQPAEYIRCLIEGNQGDWLPIFYFAQKSGLDRDALNTAIKKMQASPHRKKVFLDRVAGKKVAYVKASPTSALILAKLANDEAPQINSPKDASLFATALRGLIAKPKTEIAPLLAHLSKCHEIAKDQPGGVVMSIVRQAICRVDEIFFPLS